MIEIEICGYDEAAKMGHNDAALADQSTEGRVLALAARLRTAGQPAAKGLVDCYISQFLRARGLDMASGWERRTEEYFAIRTPDGRSWIRRYAEDAAADVWAAVQRGEDVPKWSVSVHREGGAA